VLESLLVLQITAIVNSVIVKGKILRNGLNLLASIIIGTVKLSSLGNIPKLSDRVIGTTTITSSIVGVHAEDFEKLVTSGVDIVSLNINILLAVNLQTTARM